MKDDGVCRLCIGLMAFSIVSIWGCRKSETPVGPENGSYADQFDSLWTHFDREYCYFDYKNVDWKQSYDLFRPRVDTLSSNENFLVLCASMLEPLRDVHVYFSGPGNSYVPTYRRIYTPNWSTTLYAAYHQKYRSRQLDPGLGYAVIDSVVCIGITTWTSEGVSISDFDSILDSCRDMLGIVLDVRPNGGGNQNLALQVAGRFTTVPRAGSYYSVRSGPGHSDFTPPAPIWNQPRGWTWTKPVAVLTGPSCFSSNEGFISAMRAIPGVILIGDTTGGGSGNPRFYSLWAGWQYSVPQWVEYTADSAIIEWKGIAPDIEVPFLPSDFANGIDTVLEYAVRWVKEGAPNPAAEDIAVNR